MDNSVDNSKNHFRKRLNINGLYTQEDLENLFRVEIDKVIKLDGLTSEYYKEQVMFLNNAISCLSDSSKAVSNSESVMCEKLCNKLGITYEEAKKMHYRYGSSDGLDKWLNNCLLLQEQCKNDMEKAVEIYLNVNSLAFIRFDRFVSMYILDNQILKKHNMSFLQWIQIFTQVYIKMLDNGIKVEINSEFNEFLETSTSSFIQFLNSKINIKVMCNELGIQVYEAQHLFDYSNNIGAPNLEEYLKNIVSKKRIDETKRDLLAQLNITEDDFLEFYSTSIREGYTFSEIDFLNEMKASMPYLISLNMPYFPLKSKYETMDEDKKPSSFIRYLEILDATKELGGPLKVIENMYEKACEENESTCTLSDFVKITATRRKK